MLLPQWFCFNIPFISNDLTSNDFCWEACMKYEIYRENTRFIFTDFDHPKLISKWCKNLNNTFIVTFDTSFWSMSVKHMRIGKEKEMLLAQHFWKGYSFGKNNSLISAIFGIISIYNFDKIYVDNPPDKTLSANIKIKRHKSVFII